MSAQDNLSPQQFYHDPADRPALGNRLHELGMSDDDLDWMSYCGPQHEIRDVIKRVQGNADAQVPVYRTGGPVSKGDWVSLTPHYASDFRPGAEVHSATVPAKHLRYAHSDFMDEFGYDPEDKP